MSHKLNEHRIRFTSERPSGPVELEGVLSVPSREERVAGVVLCHPHPAGGGQMDVPLLVTLQVSLSALGIAVLRFNFAGVGGSQGDFTDGFEEPHDIDAAFAHLGTLTEVAGDQVSLTGWSFGSWVALMAVAEGLQARSVVAIAPPLIAYDWKVDAPRIAGSTARRYYIVGEKDQFCPQETMRSFARAVSAADEEHITFLPGADHFLLGREDEVARLVGHFLTT